MWVAGHPHWESIMLCWSCGKEIPDNATRCSHCEADVVVPSSEDLEVGRELLDQMDPEVMSELRKIVAGCATGEEFVNQIMVGECPNCGSDNTGNCEHDPDVDDLTIGRCFECGHLWCSICDAPFTAGQASCPGCDKLESEIDLMKEDWDDDDSPEISRYHLLAAEIFGYSFANYLEHLMMEDASFETEMPAAARLLEHALQENWPATRVGRELFPDNPLNERQAQNLLDSCRNALLVVDAESPAESFRNAVRQSIQEAITDGLNDEQATEDLVAQICYRASDFAVLLELHGESILEYSDELRGEDPVDDDEEDLLADDDYDNFFDDDDDDDEADDHIEDDDDDDDEADDVGNDMD